MNMIYFRAYDVESEKKQNRVIYYSNPIVSKNVFHVQSFDKDKIHITAITSDVISMYD